MGLSINLRFGDEEGGRGGEDSKEVVVDEVDVADAEDVCCSCCNGTGRGGKDEVFFVAE